MVNFRRDRRRAIMKERYDSMMKKIFDKVFSEAKSRWDQQSLKYQREVRKRASLTIRLSLAEKERLIAVARGKKLKLSEVIREALLPKTIQNI